MKPIKAHDLVRFKPSRHCVVHGCVKEGDEGTVVHIYHDQDGKEIGLCEVEFPALCGNTMTLLTTMIEPI